jgi:nucleoside-diphosphate-sugar epimerase
VRVVVTGATGFVGANLVRRLIGEGQEVHALVRREHDDWRLRSLGGAIHLHSVDLGDAAALQRVLDGIQPARVFHLAVYGAYPAQTDIATMVQTNIVSTVNLVKASIRAGAQVIVNTGSSSEYGFKRTPPRESDPAEPNSAYAVTKLSATLLCRELAKRHAVRVPTLRLYSVYGPFEQPTRLIPKLLVAAMQGQLPPLAHPATARDFVYVDDVVSAYLAVADTDDMNLDAVFNVGTGVQTSIEAVVGIVRNMLGVSQTPRWGSYPARTWDTDSWVADPTRLRTEVGWQPRYSIAQGLQAMLDWLNCSPQYLERYRAAWSDRAM